MVSNCLHFICATCWDVPMMISYVHGRILHPRRIDRIFRRVRQLFEERISPKAEFSEGSDSHRVSLFLTIQSPRFPRDNQLGKRSRVFVKDAAESSADSKYYDGKCFVKKSLFHFGCTLFGSGIQACSYGCNRIMPLRRTSECHDCCRTKLSPTVEDK